MKKYYSGLAILITFIFTAIAASNTVTLKLENLFDRGILISAAQMDFQLDFDFPFSSDENDMLRESDFKIKTDFGDESAIFRNSVMIANWHTEPLEDYNGTNGISKVNGFTAYTPMTNVGFALHDGFLAELTSENSIFRVDLETIQLFDFFDTAKPISGLIITQEIDGNDQLITISSVPIPTTLFLLGSGFIGLVGIRKRRINK